MFEHLSNVSYVDPVANQTHYVVMVETSQQRSTVVTASPAEARKLVNQAGGNRVSVKPFASRSQATAFANRWLRGR